MGQVVYGKHYVRIPNEIPSPPDSLSYPLDWAEDAACKGMDFDLFYDFRVSTRYVRIQRDVYDACEVCCVQEQCLAWALLNESTRDSESGVFARLVPSQRRKLINSMGGFLVTLLEA